MMIADGNDWLVFMVVMWVGILIEGKQVIPDVFSEWYVETIPTVSTTL